MVGAVTAAPMAAAAATQPAGNSLVVRRQAAHGINLATWLQEPPRAQRPGVFYAWRFTPDRTYALRTSEAEARQFADAYNERPELARRGARAEVIVSQNGDDA
jgi:hypothetical protein